MEKCFLFMFARSIETQYKISRVTAFYFVILFSIFFSGSSFCQRTDTTETVTDTAKINRHSPMVATIMSAALPGLGQVYNKKYWKIPIIYGGLFTAGYFLKINREEFHKLKTAYIAEVDADTSTSSQIALPVEGLKSYMDFYRTRVEICYIAMGVLYILNIVDATVDAHLFTFDVSDNLSLSVTPEINWASADKTRFAGLRLVLKL